MPLNEAQGQASEPIEQQTANQDGTAPTKSAKKTSSKKSKKKPTKRTTKKATSKGSNSGRRSTGTIRAFPNATFESVLPLAQTIFDQAGASSEMMRVTAFEKLGKASESGPSKMLVSNSTRYGLTTGGSRSDMLGLTETAIRIFDPSTPQGEAVRAKF